jgi:hypothetical protein
VFALPDLKVLLEVVHGREAAVLEIEIHDLKLAITGRLQGSRAVK